MALVGQQERGGPPRGPNGPTAALPSSIWTTRSSTPSIQLGSTDVVPTLMAKTTPSRRAAQPDGQATSTPMHRPLST